MNYYGRILKSGIIGVLLGIFSTQASAALEFVDDATASTFGKSMHICGVGLMSGLHVVNNELLCNIVARNNPGFDDTNTARSGMHACPLGTAMMGAHIGDNVLKCGIPLAGSLLVSTEYQDSGTVRAGMHACPDGWVMTGVHAGNNVFLCTQLAN